MFSYCRSNFYSQCVITTTSAYFCWSWVLLHTYPDYPVVFSQKYTVWVKKGCHCNHGYNFVNSWSICKFLSLLLRALNFYELELCIWALQFSFAPSINTVKIWHDGQKPLEPKTRETSPPQSNFKSFCCISNQYLFVHLLNIWDSTLIWTYKTLQSFNSCVKVL